ncbi:tRNA (adenosine(37)-N6)-threonylcarbamoyltransferase complex ATPase subunit type 1 TsaE [Cognatishimia sp. MH4019]|uniref:tRNA (adenosine(37)-N6)-threonylcarbamoyltransferase complex ATPase subunit type 1 TsaE n=1 Tax=Cognatishimia sp. MH4019 TaxID=2854030 RepID=UPI001CD1AE56|nr:tRNA (adenosine(37)-N6)-threonylcarbamoyltransferase complex ATPase subunit type 1 TsaE [Cognatishimia sp. MH4019]
MTNRFATQSLKSADDTAQLAQAVSSVLTTGDVLLLEGPLGAGKSHFARHAIQARLGRAEDVPSPTFTLVQVYETPDLDIWHCDLYRLSDPDGAIELGLEEAFETAAYLIEWPSRLGDLRPADAVTLQLAMGAGEDHREATFSGQPSGFRTRLESVLND